MSSSAASNDEWRVSIDLDIDELPFLRLALPTVIPEERYALITTGWDASPEEAYLTLTVTATSREEAFARAADLYERLRQAASPIGPGELRIIGHVPPAFAEPLYARLGNEAAQLAKQGRHALAVIRAQSAVEVYVRTAFEDLLGRRGDRDVVSRLLTRTTASLRSPDAKDLFFVLTGERVQRAEWWSDYEQHIKRRNAILHEGLAVDESEADASLEVCEKLRAFVEAAWSRVLGLDLPVPYT